MQRIGKLRLEARVITFKMWDDGKVAKFLFNLGNLAL